MNNRVERLNTQIARVVSEAINIKMNDNRLKNITIVSVKTSSDSTFCRIGVGILADTREGQEEILSLLKKATGFIKKEIAENVKIRVIPEILFELNDNANYSNRINEILKTLNIPKEEEEDNE